MVEQSVVMVYNKLPVSLSYFLYPTEVRTPPFYYHLTTIDGIDLPQFAVFCFFRDLSHRESTYVGKSYGAEESQ